MEKSKLPKKASPAKRARSSWFERRASKIQTWDSFVKTSSDFSDSELARWIEMRVMGHLDRGVSKSALARDLDCTRKTIQNAINKYNAYIESGKPIKVGRGSKPSAQLKDYICEHMEHLRYERSFSYERIKRRVEFEFAINVPTSTIQTYLESVECYPAMHPYYLYEYIKDHYADVPLTEFDSLVDHCNSHTREEYDSDDLFFLVMDAQVAAKAIAEDFRKITM